MDLKRGIPSQMLPACVEICVQPHRRRYEVVEVYRHHTSPTGYFADYYVREVSCASVGIGSGSVQDYLEIILRRVSASSINMMPFHVQTAGVWGRRGVLSMSSDKSASYSLKQ